MLNNILEFVIIVGEILHDAVPWSIRKYLGVITIKNYFKLPFYEVYDTKHPDGKARGGTARIIKKCLNHFENEKYSEEFLQVTTITIMESKGPITLSAVYCPPKYCISSETFVKFFENLRNRFIARGDYNAKHPWWGSRLSTPNPKGRNLYELI